jgi:hypothetical protein
MHVVILGEDPAALDLVAHFLGLATHDNINAAPSARLPGTRTSEPDTAVGVAGVRSDMDRARFLGGAALRALVEWNAPFAGRVHPA